MSRDEQEVKGIIISTAPKGEYGRRVRIITDKLGKITAFAGGAAKVSSRLIGTLRPMTSASFRLAKGRGAYSIHGAEVIDAFDDLAFDFETSVYAMYVLEAGDYFSEEGMPEDDAKQLLNLMFVTMRALREKKLCEQLITSIYELRLLVLQGEYTMMPPMARRAGDKNSHLIDDTDTDSHSYNSAVNREDKNEGTEDIWQRCISSSLTALYDAGYFDGLDTDGFRANVKLLFEQQVKHRFRTLDVLKKL